MSAGLLPPSSSVTGVRFSLAARITSLPTLPEPVNSRWSKGRREKSAAASASPRHHGHVLRGIQPGDKGVQHLRRPRGQFGGFQHDVVPRRERADQWADAQEDRDSSRPTECRRLRAAGTAPVARAGQNCHGTGARRSAIHRRRCRRAWRISLITGNNSRAIVSSAARPPKSSASARTKSFLCRSSPCSSACSACKRSR